MGRIILLAKIKLTRKKIAAGGALGLLVIIAAGLGVWMLVTANERQVRTALIPIGDVQIFAAEYADSGDVDKALRLYNEQIEARTDNKEKLTLLLDKADFAVSNKRYDDAIDAGKQADKLGAGLSATLTLAKAYEAKGDKAQAVKYYRILLEKQGTAGGRDGDRWQKKIDELDK